jgi:hypothetical protein
MDKVQKPSNSEWFRIPVLNSEVFWMKLKSVTLIYILLLLRYRLLGHVQRLTNMLWNGRVHYHSQPDTGPYPKPDKFTPYSSTIKSYCCCAILLYQTSEFQIIILTLCNFLHNYIITLKFKHNSQFSVDSSPLWQWRPKRKRSAPKPNHFLFWSHDRPLSFFVIWYS